MFDVKLGEQNELLFFGRLDAAQASTARNHLDRIQETTVLDFSNLEYISSAGLSVLLFTQKRLNENGHHLKLKNLNKHIREVFRYAGFDMIFEIEE